MLAPAAQAASITAESRFCFGYLGSADKPTLNCGSGGAQGTGGGVVIGGSGVGSGFNVPLQANGGSELSASAAALQDYGVFRGYASHHLVDQGPDLPPEFFQFDANAAFQQTAILTGIAVTDLFGNPIANFTLSAQSGTQYPLVTSVVPVPGAWLFLVSGIAVWHSARFASSRISLHLFRPTGLRNAIGHK